MLLPDFFQVRGNTCFFAVRSRLKIEIQGQLPSCPSEASRFPKRRRPKSAETHKKIPTKFSSGLTTATGLGPTYPGYPPTSLNLLDCELTRPVPKFTVPIDRLSTGLSVMNFRKSELGTISGPTSCGSRFSRERCSSVGFAVLARFGLYQTTKSSVAAAFQKVVD